MLNMNRLRFIKFINSIQENDMLDLFISDLFDYKNLKSDNFVFNIKSINSMVIMDIYVNINGNHFNRYIFDFSPNEIFKVEGIYINIYKVKDNKNKIYKLAHMFSLKKREMYKYAKTFLSDEFIDILRKIK